MSVIQKGVTQRGVVQRVGVVQRGVVQRGVAEPQALILCTLTVMSFCVNHCPLHKETLMGTERTFLPVHVYHDKTLLPSSFLCHHLLNATLTEWPTLRLCLRYVSLKDSPCQEQQEEHLP